MANIRSAEKRIRTTAKKRARNKGVKTKLRSVIKGQRASGDIAGMPKTASKIDRARSKGVIHKNTASRLKSRIAKSSAKTPAAK
jgi:small subunit ribosomal protein S20